MSCPSFVHRLDPPIKMYIGAIQVLRNADGGGGGVSDFLEKSVTKV